MQSAVECASAAATTLGKDVDVVDSSSSSSFASTFRKLSAIANVLRAIRDTADSINNHGDMPAARDNNMDLCTDKVLSKGRILQELTKAVKLVYAQSLHGGVVLDGDSWLVYWLDRALRHGLRVERHGYWGIARELSHQDTVVVIHALQSVLTSIGKGRAWLYHTLSESSFESYLACLLRDSSTLKKQYFPHALVRDPDKTHQLINLLAGLENVSFTLRLDVTYLDICNYMPQRPMSGSPSGTALSLHLRSSSVSSSLASPGDSGVALDSDIEGANETDASSYKEEDSMDDTPKYRKYAQKLAGNDNKNLFRSFSSSDSSEDGKTAGKYEKSLTHHDMINKNVPAEMAETDNCSSLETLKDFSETGSGRKTRENCHESGNSGPEKWSRKLEKPEGPLETGNYTFRKKLQPEVRNSYVINNETNLLELSMTISDCDCCPEAPYSILNTVNMTDSGAMTSSSTESTVQRRQRKKKRGEAKKRVSFHEDILKTMKLEDDENFVDSYRQTTNFRRDNRPEMGRGRYSWCATENGKKEKKMVDTRKTYSDIYTGWKNDFFTPEARENPWENGKMNFSPEMAERGAPEGQEDPVMGFLPKMEIDLEENVAQEAYDVEKECGCVIEEEKSEKLEMPNCRKFSDDFSADSDTSGRESRDDTKISRHLSSPAKKRNVTAIIGAENSGFSRGFSPDFRAIFRPTAPKVSLLGRFLRSITERKFDARKNKKTGKIGVSPLYIKGAKIADSREFADFNENLEKEIRANFANYKENSTFECDFSGGKLPENLRNFVYRDKTEQLYKVYRVRSSYMNNGDDRPMLAILTDKTLYLTASRPDRAYSNQFVIPYNELDVIMIGPNAQTILISNADYEMQYLFSTGSSQTTSELIAHLEMAMRRSPSKPKLPAVKELTYEDMRILKHSVLSETSVHPDEKIEHYSLIHVEDEHPSPPSTPCGPTKEGDLMFRAHSYKQQQQQQNPNFANSPTNAWEAGYFVLKGGVVYMFSDANERLPKRAIPLKGGLCQGCRRIPNAHRPHTFEILLKPGKAFQFAAPDEYVASEWLQSFVQSASGLFDTDEPKNPLPCSLVATTRHLVTVKETFPSTQRGQTLSSASIENLTAFRVPLAQQSWCILEFACREVHENSGDWIIYFTNHSELGAFRAILENLWKNANLGDFPTVILSPEEKIHRRCTESSLELEQAWKYLLPVADQ